MTAEAESYLAAALSLMEANALLRQHIDWSAVRTEAFLRATGASLSSETYDSIRWALTQLKDGHSFFLPPERGAAAIASGRYDKEATSPDGYLRTDHVAYLRVPAFLGSSQRATRYVDDLHDLLRNLEASDPVGWMVDLTENTGGNMWPMLAGLGPLLGEQVLGSFRSPTQSPAVWSYRAGMALLDDVCLARATDTGYQLRRPEVPVALLTSQRTASSGEAVLVAFIGRPRTRRVGVATRGLTTGNDDFTLADGATLHLTVVTFADRFGELYGRTLEPDLPCDSSVDSAKAVAAAWLRSTALAES